VSGAAEIVFDRATSSGGFPECQTRNACFAGYTKLYGLKHAKFLPFAGISAYAALDAGKVLAADRFSMDRRSAHSRSTWCYMTPSTSRASRTSRDREDVGSRLRPAARSPRGSTPCRRSSRCPQSSR
jgi:hypothetical protein